jgi:hypothetical protein
VAHGGLSGGAAAIGELPVCERLHCRELQPPTPRVPVQARVRAAPGGPDTEVRRAAAVPGATPGRVSECEELSCVWGGDWVAVPRGLHPLRPNNARYKKSLD